MTYMPTIEQMKQRHQFRKNIKAVQADIKLQQAQLAKIIAK